MTKRAHTTRPCALPAAVATGLLALAAAASGSAQEATAVLSDFAATAAAVRGAHVPVTPAPPAFAVPVLAGRWAQEFVTTSVSRVPVLGDLRSETRTLLMLDVTQAGDVVTIGREVCSVQVGGGGGVVRTVIPPAFVAALPTDALDVRIVSNGGRLGLEGWERAEVIGADVSAGEALPVAPDDTRVTDADGDGAPGVTVQVRGLVNGDIYLVQRGWSRLETTLVTSERIEGTIAWSTEQVILDATTDVLRDAPLTWPDPDADRNRFVMVRVDAGTGCLDLERGGRRVFGR
jgi:hypothetical protein